MGYRAPFPPELEQVEYVKLYFHLEICDSFDLPALALLQLRRELLQALKILSAQNSVDFVRSLDKLIKPDLPTDPVLLRQIQKPPPALVISADISQFGLIKPKQRIILPVLFVGSGIDAIDQFVSLLQQLGPLGLHRGSGQFVLEGVEAEDGSGVRSMLWFASQQPDELIPPVSNLSWWLERQPCSNDPIKLEIISPLRLLQRGKPLFKAQFVDIFPYLLRRVTALLMGHAGIELFLDPARLISLSSQVKILENQFRWQDWRTLKRDQENQNLGGLMGYLTVSGEELAELIWILQLGSLLNFGKGATYGAGQYRVCYT
ncbi:MAG: CRISPR system precrRNA processing endoribonuclease RAMP protein Cas6 [Desulfuromusa sp.]|nr:CRISPR system precrRNA processing endoribonuclease RAMP protein Cas6 [Desulfuromusa sp.]